MSRDSVLLAALTAEPTSTSDLYDRVGYVALMRIGLVPYDAFRRELERLRAEGLVESEGGGENQTLWWLADVSRRPPAGSDP